MWNSYSGRSEPCIENYMRQMCVTSMSRQPLNDSIVAKDRRINILEDELEVTSQSQRHELPVIERQSGYVKDSDIVAGVSMVVPPTRCREAQREKQTRVIQAATVQSPNSQVAAHSHPNLTKVSVPDCRST